MLLVYKISARFAICFNCCQPLCVQPTAVAWCVRVIRQSSSSSVIVGPTKVAWCVPSFTQQQSQCSMMR